MKGSRQRRRCPGHIAGSGCHLCWELCLLHKACRPPARDAPGSCPDRTERRSRCRSQPLPEDRLHKRGSPSAPCQCLVSTSGKRWTWRSSPVSALVRLGIHPGWQSSPKKWALQAHTPAPRSTWTSDGSIVPAASASLWTKSSSMQTPLLLHVPFPDWSPGQE